MLLLLLSRSSRGLASRVDDSLIVLVLLLLHLLLIDGCLRRLMIDVGAAALG